MKHSVPEEEYMDDEYENDESYTDEEYDDGDYAETGGSRTIALLIAAVSLCLVILVGILAYSRFAPQFAQEDGDSDPASKLHSVHLLEEQELKENPILETSEPEETTEPTIPPELSPYDQYDFQYGKNNYLYCLKQESVPGVDVSAFQGNINWAQVKQSGIGFAMLRLGYRGWGAKGTLVEDEYIQQNLAATSAVGMPIGAYFFSQATTLAEVAEEIDFMLEILGDYQLQYPIVLDWEIADPNGRNVNVDRRTLTNMLRYFCDEMIAKGFDPMIYFNWTQSSRMIYLNELEDVPFWLALYQDRMTYPYRVEMWQYTNQGTVPGIEGDVDINLYIPDLTK